MPGLPTQDLVKRRRQLVSVLATVTVLPFGAEETPAAPTIAAKLEAVGEPIGPLHTLIAGAAWVHGGTLVTRNIREFGRIEGLRIENWYEG